MAVSRRQTLKVVISMQRQRKRSISVSEQIAALVTTASPTLSDADWIIEQLEAERATDTRAWQDASDALRTRLSVLDEKLRRLLDGYLDKDISSDEYRTRRAELLGDRQQLKADLTATERHRMGWFEPAIRFSKGLKHGAFLATKGTDEEKCDFMKKIGSNLKLVEGRLALEPRHAWKLVVDQGRFVHHNTALVPSAAACVGETHLSLKNSG